MGVPTFFRWICVRYPKIIRDTLEREPVEMDGRMVPIDLDEDAPNGEFDALYLDMNGIIHPCCHPEDGPAPEDEEHMYENIFLYLDRLIRIVRPKKLLYMAIDGVAPRAKMNQQRARRFRAAQERDETEREIETLRADWEAEGRQLPNRSIGKVFDSNVITPGTLFLHKMSEAVRYFIHDRMTNDPLWHKLKFRCVLSDANIPGEGEHKVMDYIRAQRTQPEYDPNFRHCLYGADADLIMLGLATHEAHFCIIREVVIQRSEKKCNVCGGTGHMASECMGDPEEGEELPSSRKPFQILSVQILRQYLQLQYAPLESQMTNLPYDFERCVDDFVFMCFFVGNDFLPHLPSLNIRDGSIDQMMALYQEILPTLENYFTDSGVVNLPQVETFVEYLGGIEDQIFKIRLEREAKRRSEVDDVREKDGAPMPNSIKLSEPAVPKGSAVKTEDDKQAGGAAGSAKEAKAKAKALAEADDSNAWHAQLLAESFSVDAENIPDEEDAEEKNKLEEEKKKKAEEAAKPKSGKFVSKEFHACLKERLLNRQDLGTSMADTIRLGEGPHWKQRYYFDKFKVKQDDLVDFLQRIRKAYIEGICWVLTYYYQGCCSWTWFYPYHYAPFASDLLGCGTLDCNTSDYFKMGTPFQPFQQLMSVLPPVSAKTAGLPAAFLELMNQPFSPLIDFYPVDFGLDLNGKRFTYMAVILLPFIDEPRLVRIVAPLLKRLNEGEKIRNRRGQELVFGHQSDAVLLSEVQVAQAAFEAGDVGYKHRFNHKHRMFGYLQGNKIGGIGRTIVSPIEGLPDVEESQCMCTFFCDPDRSPHSSQLLPGITREAIVINSSDLDEKGRLFGFGGEPAKRLIMQALGRDPSKKSWRPDNKEAATTQKETPEEKVQPEKKKAKVTKEDAWDTENVACKEAWEEAASKKKKDLSKEAASMSKKELLAKARASVGEEDWDEAGGAWDALPPSGSKVIKVHGAGGKGKGKGKGSEGQGAARPDTPWWGQGSATAWGSAPY